MNTDQLYALLPVGNYASMIGFVNSLNVHYRMIQVIQPTEYDYAPGATYCATAIEVALSPADVVALSIRFTADVDYILMVNYVVNSPYALL